MRLLVRLYPAAWRARYEDEFLAVLEERPLSPFDAVDILLGALDARLRPRSLAIDLAPRRNPPMNPRIAGYAAVAGGGLTLLMMLLGFVLPQPTNGVAVFLYPFAAVALLIAVVGLGAVQGRRNPVLGWAAVVVPAAGLLVSLVGVLGGVIGAGDEPMVAGLNSWALWSLGLSGFAIGSILFAVATIGVGVLSRGGALTLLIGSLIVSGIFLPTVIGLINPDGVPVMQMAIVAGVVLFCAGWMWLGYAATVQRPIASSAAA
jgi:hypothetical protein